MSDEEITILLPVRAQRRDFFEAAVRSVLDQSSPRWRLLAGLEQSPDWIAERLAGPADPRIEVVECPRPGLGGALNALMERATTPFVCVLLSDDMLAPRAVETLLQHRKAHPEVDYFHSSRRYLDPRG